MELCLSCKRLVQLFVRIFLEKCRCTRVVTLYPFPSVSREKNSFNVTTICHGMAARQEKQLERIRLRILYSCNDIRSEACDSVFRA